MGERITVAQLRKDNFELLLNLSFGILVLAVAFLFWR
jgi:hypothetical protein